MSKNYEFNQEMSKYFKPNEAIVIHNLRFWIRLNESKKTNYYDGRYWTYDSYEGLARRIGCLNAHQIGRIMRNLETKEVILSSNHNKTSYDRTKWYAFSDYGETLVRKCYNEDADANNPSYENVQPIPDGKTDCITSSLITYGEILARLNEQTGSTFEVDKHTKALIDARLKEGYTEEDFITVIDKACAVWGNNLDMKFNLRPDVLFGTKMAGYLHVAVSNHSSNKSFDDVDFLEAAIQRTYAEISAATEEKV